jgi:plastocyanin
MLPSTALLLLSLPLALAQYGGGGAPPAPTTSTTPAAAPPATPTSSSSASLQTVTVGDNEAFAFSPNSLVAAVGSQVEFIFFPPTHSVVQASFDAPCQPSNSSAFFSGAFTTSSGPNVRCPVLCCQQVVHKLTNSCHRQTVLPSLSTTRIQFGFSVDFQLIVRLAWLESSTHR